MPTSKIRDMARGNPLSPPSSAEASVPQRVTLPSDLSTSLRNVDDAELERLRVALAAEINRRDQGASTRHADERLALPPANPEDEQYGRGTAGREGKPDTSLVQCGAQTGNDRPYVSCVAVLGSPRHKVGGQTGTVDLTKITAHAQSPANGPFEAI